MSAATSVFGHRELETLMGFGMSAEQLPVVLGPLTDPAVVIAGAGSGKTTLMAARMVTLIARGDAEPEEILGLTFTRKAAPRIPQEIRSNPPASADGRQPGSSVAGMGRPMPLP